MRQKFTKKQQGPKRGRQRISGQGRQARSEQAEYTLTRKTMAKRHRTIDDNSTGDK